MEHGPRPALPPLGPIPIRELSYRDGCYDGYGNYYYDCSNGLHWWAYLVISLALAITLGVIAYIFIRRYQYRRSLAAQGIVPPPYNVGLAQQYPQSYPQPYPQPYPQQQYPAQYPPYTQPNVTVIR